MTDPLTIKDRLEIILRIVIVCIIILAITFFSVNYAFHSHPEMDTYIVNIEYHPTNRGSVVIENMPEVVLEGTILPIRITGLFEQVNYSIYNTFPAERGDLSMVFFTDSPEKVFWIQILEPNQEWILTREYLNETVWVARIYLI